MKIIKKKKNPQSYDREEKFWEEVDSLAQEKIYQVLTTNIPFQNIPLIKEPWRFEEAQQKKVGLFLDRDVDYRTLGADVENDYRDNLPSKDQVSQEIAYEYLFLVVKILLEELSKFDCHQEGIFTQLTN